jgi:hypothetical protein
VQAAALPSRLSLVQTLPSLQLVGQLAGGSQLSPASSTPLPQTPGQSASVAALQPAGQQPSAVVEQVVMGGKMQWAVQLAALPISMSAVQGSRSLQSRATLVGQLEGGSQYSPTSTIPLPQVREQSGSLTPVQPGAQQPSAAPQLVIAV